MKAAILYGARDLRIEDRSLAPDDLAPGQIYVETIVSALSIGTDLGNYEGRSTEIGGPPYPRWVGYSNVGRVVQVGSTVTRVRPGQRVFATQPHQSAYVANENSIIVPIPDAAPSDQAAFAYIAHLGLAAMRSARYEPGENVAVIGLGIIGLCTLALAHAMGARVIGLANSPIRRELALRVGADAAYLVDDPTLTAEIDRWSDGIGADIVINTANPWPAHRLSLEIVREGGRIANLGFPGRQQPLPDFNPLDPKWLYGKQLTLTFASHAPVYAFPANRVAFEQQRGLALILDVIARQQMDLSPLISHRLPYSRMKEAYDLAANHDKSLVGVLFEWNRD